MKFSYIRELYNKIARYFTNTNYRLVLYNYNSVKRNLHLKIEDEASKTNCLMLDIKLFVLTLNNAT